MKIAKRLSAMTPLIAMYILKTGAIAPHVTEDATTSARAPNAPEKHIHNLPMVLVRLGVAAMLVHIGKGPAQVQKAGAQHALRDNIRPLPMC